LARALVSRLSDKDEYTGWHSQNVAKLMYELADDMGFDTKYKEEALVAGLVHDIGKVKIPPYILNKPGVLTTVEYKIIKAHPEFGVRILGRFGSFDKILDAIRHHHERYDGKGYPDGREGTDIPLFSRMLAICDTFDAMTSKRCYRPPHEAEEALAELELCAGTQFDPEISQQFICMMGSSCLGQNYYNYKKGR